PRGSRYARGHTSPVLESLQFVDEAATEFWLRRISGLARVEARGLIEVRAVLREESETFVTAPGTKARSAGGIAGQGRQRSLQHGGVHDGSTSVDAVHEVTADASSFRKSVGCRRGGHGVGQFHGFVVSVNHQDGQDGAQNLLL